ncbi:MAG TPA: cellulase N-terminal Ig-like domain-containing protein, partial [Rhodothermales bacterium]
MSRLLLAGMLVSSAAAQTSVEPLPSEQIRLNQVGFYPDGPKRAAVVDAAEGPFSVVSAETGEIAFTGTLGAERNWQWSGENVCLADFSSLTNEGFYYLDVPGVGTSYPFVIAPNAHEEVTRGSLKALYYQRVSTALESEHAGAWARLLGHPD